MAKAAKRLVICVDNSGYEVSLERRKIYVAIPDARAEEPGDMGNSHRSRQSLPQLKRALDAKSHWRTP